MCIYHEDTTVSTDKTIYQFEDKSYTAPKNGVPDKVLKKVFLDKLKTSQFSKFELIGEYITSDQKSIFKCTECFDEFECRPREVLVRGRNCSCDWNKRVSNVHNILSNQFPNLIFKSTYTHILETMEVECINCGYKEHCVANSLLSMKGDFSM